MTGPNGHAQDAGSSTFVAPPAASPLATSTQFSPEKVKELVAALEVPFDASQIEWRVMNTTKNGQPLRGQVVPYADQRAYTDRLNTLFTPAGWTRKYSIQTSASFERSNDQKIVAKGQAAERGLLRAKAAREKAGPASFAAVLGSMKLSSLEQVDNLNTLKEIIVALETASARAT